MQVVHFAFSIGTLVAPLATEPFLAKLHTNCLLNENLTLTTDLPLNHNVSFVYLLFSNVSSSTDNLPFSEESQ